MIFDYLNANKQHSTPTRPSPFATLHSTSERINMNPYTTMDGLSFIPEGSTFANFNDAKYALWRATVDSHKSYTYSKGSVNEGFFVYVCPAKKDGCGFRLRMACKSEKNGGDGSMVTVTISKPHDPDPSKCPRHIHTKWTGAGNSAFIARRHQAIFEYDIGVKSSAILAAEKNQGNEINADQARRAVRKGRAAVVSGTVPGGSAEQTPDRKRKAQHDQTMKTPLKKARQGAEETTPAKRLEMHSTAYMPMHQHGHGQGQVQGQAQSHGLGDQERQAMGEMPLEDQDANGE